MNRLIRLNKNRYEKTMISDKEDGEPVRIERPESVLDQNRLIADELRAMGEGESAAVIYRRNRSGLLMAYELWRQNIDFNIEKSRIKEFFYQSVFKDIIAFCKLVDNPFDTQSFRQIYHKMGLFISREEMEKIVRNGGLTEVNIRNLGLSKKNRERFIKRLKTMKRIKNMSVRLLFEELEISWGYVDYLEDAGDAYGYQKNSSKAIFHIMKSMVGKNETPRQYYNKLRDFWSAIAKMNGNAVISLSAVHSVKGLEFDRVYVIDLVKDEFPFKAAAHGDDPAGGSMEEERCLFYVAGTRAKTMLCLLSPRNFYGADDVVPSEFLGEAMGQASHKALDEKPGIDSINKEADPGMRFVLSLDEIGVGQRVKLKKMGFGTIEDICKERDRLYIKFGEEKKGFILSDMLKNSRIQIPIYKEEND